MAIVGESAGQPEQVIPRPFGKGCGTAADLVGQGAEQGSPPEEAPSGAPGGLAGGEDGQCTLNKDGQPAAGERVPPVSQELRAGHPVAQAMGQGLELAFGGTFGGVGQAAPPALGRQEAQKLVLGLKICQGRRGELTGELEGRFPGQERRGHRGFAVLGHGVKGPRDHDMQQNAAVAGVARMPMAPPAVPPQVDLDVAAAGGAVGEGQGCVEVVRTGATVAGAGMDEPVTPLGAEDGPPGGALPVRVE